MDGFLNDEAQVGVPSGNRLKAGIAAGEQQDFDWSGEDAGLGGGKGQVPLEADEVVDRAGRAAVAAQFMLSGGEEGGAGTDGSLAWRVTPVSSFVRPRIATPRRIFAPRAGRRSAGLHPSRRATG